MAALETGIRDAILGDAAIAAIVGSRVRPIGLAGDDDRPYLTYNVTSRKSDSSLSDGVSDYHKAEFEVGVFGDHYAEVMELSDLLRNRLDQYGQTVSGIEFAPIEFDDETDIEEAVPEGENTFVYLRVQNYRALYSTP